MGVQQFSTTVDTSKVAFSLFLVIKQQLFAIPSVTYANISHEQEEASDQLFAWFYEHFFILQQVVESLELWTKCNAKESRLCMGNCLSRFGTRMVAVCSVLAPPTLTHLGERGNGGAVQPRIVGPGKQECPAEGQDVKDIRKQAW